MYLSLILHDIGKTVSVERHITLSGVLSKQILHTLGFNYDDIDLGALLVENHSIFSRLMAGDETYASLAGKLAPFETNENTREILLSALTVTNVGDIGGGAIGIVEPAILTTVRLRTILSRLGDQKFVDQQIRDELELYSKMAMQTGAEEAAKIKDILASRQLNGNKLRAIRLLVDPLGHDKNERLRSINVVKSTDELKEYIEKQLIGLNQDDIKDLIVIVDDNNLSFEEKKAAVRLELFEIYTNLAEQLNNEDNVRKALVRTSQTDKEIGLKGLNDKAKKTIELINEI